MRVPGQYPLQRLLRTFQRHSIVLKARDECLARFQIPGTAHFSWYDNSTLGPYIDFDCHYVSAHLPTSMPQS